MPGQRFGSECHFGSHQMPAVLLHTRGYFKGKKGNSSIKKERKRKRQKGKEIEKKGMAICSDVARRMAGREGRPDFSTVRCCVSLDKSTAFSEPL